MDNHRIYGNKVTIDTKVVKDFYNRQMEKADNPLGAVFLGSQDQAVLNEKNTYTRNTIIPKLDIKQDTRVLDLGCGIGRLAQEILPDCGFYCGVDFSERMVECARDLCTHIAPTERFKIHCLSMTEAVSAGNAVLGGPFGVVLLSGVLVYLNDSEVQKAVCMLSELLEKRCTIYWGDPVGLQKRLTLKDFPSESFQTDYSAIYRTVSEYLELFQPLFKAGFTITEQAYMPKFGETYTDTGRYYMLLHRE